MTVVLITILCITYFSIMYGFDDDQYERFRYGREELRQPTFIETCTQLMGSVQDVITVDGKSSVVDIDIFLDVLSELESGEESLQLQVVRRIRSEGHTSMQMYKLVELMRRYIEQLPLKENLEKWWTSFKNAGNGGNEQSFQAKKLIDYLSKLQGSKSLPKEQQQMFKYRNDWTKNQLAKACRQS